MKKAIIGCVLFIGTFLTVQAQRDTIRRQVPDTILKEFEGKYIFSSGSVIPDVTVKFENGILTCYSTEGSSMLNKLGLDSFAIPSFEGTAVFKRNTGKKISHVIVDAMGYHLEGTKENPVQVIIE